MVVVDVDKVVTANDDVSDEEVGMATTQQPESTAQVSDTAGSDDLKKDYASNYGASANTDKLDSVDKEKEETEGGAEGENEEDEEDPTTAKYRMMLKKGLKYASLLLLVVYLLAAFIIDFQRAKALFVITCLVVAGLIYGFFAKRHQEQIEAFQDGIIAFLAKADSDWKTGGGLIAILCTIMVILMAVSVRNGRNLISLFGLFVFLGLTWVFSAYPTKVKLRPVIGGLFIQFIFGYVVIKTSWGFEAVDFLSFVFTTLLNYTYAGSEFVYGWLVDGSLFGRPFQLADGSEYLLAPPLFFNVLPSVIFFSSLMSVGYYIGAIPWLVRKLGYILSIFLGSSASESLSAAGNIFVGQTEAPLLVRPFMAEMTKSELHAIMTGGFATIAGGVFGVYISFGVPGTAILAASVMSAPAALAISKIAYPELEDSPTAVEKKGVYNIPPTTDANVVHAAANGAYVGTQLALNIAGNLIAFLALIEMFDQLLIYLGNRVDIALSFNDICSVIFYPVAWLMGVDGDDCKEVAILLGLKIFANEFVAYEKLAFEFGDQISKRSYYIASFALCGFSNLSSIGIQLGGLTPLAPNQGKNLAKLVVSACIAGNTACLITACIAGIFYDDNEIE